MAAADHVENIALLTQSTLKIRDTASQKLIYIDPFKVSESDSPDVIFITHPHFDHCDPSSLEKLYRKGVPVYVSEGCEEKIISVVAKPDIHVLHPGDKIDIYGIRGFTVPAYNVAPERLSFHPKENRWLGYVLEVGGKRIYHAGDTDTIPEMGDLQGIDIAFLPVGGTYTMDAEEAARAAELINPKIAVPMHAIPAGDQKEAVQKRFKELAEKAGKKAKIINGKGSFD